MEETARLLRQVALAYDGVEEGVACEGTALEKRTLKVGRKAFVFLGTKDVMLKLGPSLAEASKLASKDPGRFKVGSNGWVTVKTESRAPLAVLERWLAESYLVMKEPGKKPPAKKAPAKKPPPKKPAKKPGS